MNNNCRGGPPWPPQPWSLRWGGHGGPPLQCAILGSTSSRVSCFFCHDDAAFRMTEQVIRTSTMFSATYKHKFETKRQPVSYLFHLSAGPSLQLAVRKS